MSKAVLIASILSLCGYAGACLLGEINFDQDIGGHLKLAADANSTELAEERLSIAVESMRNRNFCLGATRCSTSIIYKTPDEDVGYWRENIEYTLKDLQSMSKEERANNLIESNQLIKVRETLMDGNQVTTPPGIARYPSNGGYALWGSLSLIALLISGGIAFRDY